MTKHEYVRNYHGNMIHKAGCPKIGKKALLWAWAKGKSEQQLRDELKPLVMVKYCKACFGDPDREETERQLLRDLLRGEHQDGV